MQKDLIMNCPQCKAKLAKREGRYGPFMGCPNFPCCKGFASKKPQEIYYSPDYSEFDEGW